MTLRLGAISLFLLAAPFALAQTRSDFITLVYDVRAREFACWLEGRVEDIRPEKNPPNVNGNKPLPGDPCAWKDDRVHPYLKDRIYFYRGQTILLFSRRSMIQDQITVKVEDKEFAVPETPVFDKGTALPKLTDLPTYKDVLPASPIIKGLSISDATKAGRTEATTRLDLFGSVDRLDNDTFNALITSSLITPTSDDKLQPVLSPTFTNDLQSVKDNAPRLRGLVDGVSGAVQRIGPFPPPNPLDPDGETELEDFNAFVDGVASMNWIVDQERALSASVVTSGIVPHAQAVVNAIPVLEDAKFQPLRSIAPFLTTTIRAGSPTEALDGVSPVNGGPLPILERFSSNQIRVSLESVIKEPWEIASYPAKAELQATITDANHAHRTEQVKVTITLPADAQSIDSRTRFQVTAEPPGNIIVNAPVSCVNCLLDEFLTRFDAAFASNPSRIDELVLDDAKGLLADPCAAGAPKPSAPAKTFGITCIQPPALQAGGSEPRTLVVKGAEFSEESQVMWDKTPLITMFVNPQRLLAAAPITLFKDPANVKITVSNGSNKTSEAARLTVWTGQVVESVEWKQGVVTIRGSGFPTSDATILWTTADGVDHTLRPTKIDANILTATISDADFKNARVSVMSRTAVSNALQPIESNQARVQYAFKTPHPAGEPFLKALNSRPGPINSDSLDKLKKNLNSVLKTRDAIDLAQRRAVRFSEVDSALKPYRNGNDPVSALQTGLSKLATDSVAKASEIDSYARNTPLPARYRVANIGAWYDNKEVTVTVSSGGRLTLFDVAEVGKNSSSTVAAAPGTTPSNPSIPSAATTAVAPATSSTASTLVFRVHQLYHLQLA